MIKLTLSPSLICRHQLSPRASGSLYFSFLLFCLVGYCVFWEVLWEQTRSEGGKKIFPLSLGKQRQGIRFHFSFSNLIFFQKKEISCISNYVTCHVSEYGRYGTVYVYRMEQTRRNGTLELDSSLGVCGSGGTPAACVGNEVASQQSRFLKVLATNQVVIQVRSWHWRGHSIRSVVKAW